MLKPLENRVVLKLEEKEQTVGGLVLASSAQEKSQVASVVAVGPGRLVDGKLVAPTVKVGDKVVFEKFAGTTVKDGDQELLVVSDSDLLAIVE